MTRLIFFLLLVAGLGFLFAWFADRPGEVFLVWQGMRYETSLMVVISGLVALVTVILIIWWTVATILRSPALMRRFFRNRRRDRGYHALSHGLIAAGSGDTANARRLARESRKLLGSEALVQLLDAQTLLLENNHEDARARFEQMLEDDDTRLVALRGLFLEAEREGAREASQHYAQEAMKLSPALSWAGGAMLRHQSAEGDWQGALRTLETMRAAGAIDKTDAQRKRAVLLTAEAMAEAQGAPEKAAKLAREAHRLAEDLVPAAVVAAAALARTGDLRRASNILETTWKQMPHPEIAEAYVHLRSGDSVLDRLKRARKLAGMQPDHVESQLAIAEAAIAAHDWKAAREALKPVLADRPTQRACLVMADIEEGEYGDKGRMRDWFARAVRAPRDPAWMADGQTSEHWLPMSPVTGRLDAFEWKQPVDMLAAPRADLEISERDIESLPVDAEVEIGEAPEGQREAPAVEEVPKPGKKPPETEKPGGKAEPAGKPEEKAAKEEPDKSEAQEGATVFPLKRLPDDPGIEAEEAEEKEKAFRLF